MNEDDILLIRKYELGDSHAIDELLNKYLSTVYGFVFRLVNKREEAEDITQETFLKALKGLSSFNKDKNFKVWLLSIARHSVVDYFRKKKSVPFSFFDREEVGDYEESLADDTPDILHGLEKEEYLRSVEIALSKLSKPEQIIIAMKHDESLTFEEMSRVLDRPMNTVKSIYNRAIKKVRIELESLNLHQKS